MIRDNSDASWEKWGNSNPYYGVLADDKFRLENLNDQSKAEFLESGRIHIERVLAIARNHFGTSIPRKTALDFGCGVGRLVIPLSRHFDRVTGVDISSAMLRVGKRNCLEHNINNVEFVPSDDELTRVTGKFDFIHCYLVLQHIPVRRGEEIIAQLTDRLSSGGILAMHFPFMRNASTVRKSVHFLRRNFAPLSVLVNVIQRKRWNEPFMQMNSYDVNRVLRLLSKSGVKDVFLEVVDAGGFVSTFIFAKKSTTSVNFKEKHLWELGTPRDNEKRLAPNG